MSMRTRVLFHVTVGGLLLAGAIGAHAANLGFRSDTPVVYVKTRDIDLVTAAVFSALNHKPDGESASWVNEGTGNSTHVDVAITRQSTAKEGGCTSRDASVVLNAKGHSMTLRPQFCRAGGDAWQLQKKL